MRRSRIRCWRCWRCWTSLPEDSPFLKLDPPQRRQRTLEGLTRLLLRESQVQPLLLVFEDPHWIDAEAQALLDRLVESLPTACLLLLGRALTDGFSRAMEDWACPFWRGMSCHPLLRLLSPQTLRPGR